MRIFKSCPNYLACIVGEMINIETGLHYFEKGELVPSEGPRAPYLVFRRKHLTRTIKYVSEGLLILPDRKYEISKIEEMLTTMYRQAGFKDSYEVLRQRRPLHTASGHFTSITAVASDNVALRSFVHPRESSTSSVFSWYQYTIEDNPPIWDPSSAVTLPVSLQLFTILYDARDLTTFAHNQRYDSNFTFLHFRCLGKPVLECYRGNLPDLFKKFSQAAKSAKQDLIPQVAMRDYEAYHAHPSYLPGLARVDLGIRICPIRGPFFEIARALGRASAFGSLVPIDSLFGVVIYSVDYRKVVWEPDLKGAEPSEPIESSSFQALKPHQFCQRCRTPIYGEGYVVFASGQSPRGRPYCMTCMHLRYNEQEDPDPKGKPLWQGKLLGRYKALLSLEDVLQMLPNQAPDYLAILRSEFEAVKYLANENSKSGSYVLWSSEYVGVTDSIRDYVDRYLGYEQKHNFEKRRPFPCEYIRAW